MIRVDQPLFLITQAQRSGGTLLLRLLDGHPELHVVPFQLRGIDQAAKRMPATSAQAWSALHDPRLVERYEEGYRQRKGAVLDDDVTHSFELDPERQREVYDECAAALDRPTTRDLFACYFTSYFSAWRDYAGVGPHAGSSASSPGSSAACAAARLCTRSTPTAVGSRSCGIRGAGTRRRGGGSRNGGTARSRSTTGAGRRRAP